MKVSNEIMTRLVGLEPNPRWWFRGAMLVFWAVVSFGGVYWARDLSQWTVPGWGGAWGYWMAAQGAVLLFILIVVVYAGVMNRLDARTDEVQEDA
jgi:putative solute:sodium symporter small subunit